MAIVNKFKSTNIYGAFNNLDYPDNSVQASANIQRDLVVGGSIKSKILNFDNGTQQSSITQNNNNLTISTPTKLSLSTGDLEVISNSLLGGITSIGTYTNLANGTISTSGLSICRNLSSYNNETDLCFVVNQYGQNHALSMYFGEGGSVTSATPSFFKFYTDSTPYLTTNNIQLNSAQAYPFSGNTNCLATIGYINSAISNYSNNYPQFNGTNFWTDVNNFNINIGALPSFNYGYGLSIGQNITSGLYETDFVHNNGTHGGGFRFYINSNGITTGTSVPTMDINLTSIELRSNTNITGTLAVTGNATGVTPLTSDNSNKFSTTSFVKAQNYLTSASFSNYALLSGATFTGNTIGLTQLSSDSSTKFATTAFVKAQNYLSSASLSGYALLSGATFTGNISGITPVSTDNSNLLATTAYVQSQNYLTSGNAIFGTQQILH